MLWHVIYTKPKNELKVAARLEQLGIEVYCPTTTQIRQWSDRKKKIYLPLFSRYVFVRISTKDRNCVFSVPGVLGYLRYLGSDALVKDVEIRIIKNWHEKGLMDDCGINKFISGERVIIKNGSFNGKEAIIKDVGKNRCSLVLPTLGFVVTIDSKIELEKI